MREEQGKHLHGYTAALLGIFAAGFLLLVVFGTKIYLQTVAGQNSNDDRRALLTYLTTAVRAYDGQDAVVIGAGPEGDALLLRDTTADGSYEHRIYLYRGNLVEEYTPSDGALSPDSAEILGQTDTFTIEKEGRTLLRMRTEQGSVLVHLRSGEVG